MSTRCQILFRQTEKWTEKNEDSEEETVTKTRKLLTYRHSDGYPDGVILDLKRYHNWMPRKKDFEYYTATYFYYAKREHEREFCNGNPIETENGTLNTTVALGFGICDDNQLHMDIEHFYVVDLDQKLIYHYPVGFGSGYKTPEDVIKNEKPKNIYKLE